MYEMSTSIISRYDVEKLSSTVNFSLWQQKVKDILIKKDVAEVVHDSKPEGTKDTDWKRMQMKAASFSWPCLSDGE